MAEHMRVDLVLGALAAALGKRIPSATGLVFHSDRGSQYAAKDYRAALEAAGITCSMSRRDNCWDNAVAESFFATLKTELVHDVIFTSRAAAKTTIAERACVVDLVEQVARPRHQVTTRPAKTDTQKLCETVRGYCMS